MNKTIMPGLLAVLTLQVSGNIHAASIADALNFYNSTPVASPGNNNTASPSADFESGRLQGVSEGQATCLADPAACGITIGTVLGDLQFGETEPNDHIISADPMTPLVPITGQMYSAADEDWYYLETTEPNSIIILNMPESVNTWNISLLDSGGNLIANGDSLTDTELRFETTVAMPGFYYVVVRSTETYTSALYQITGQIASPVNPNGELVTNNFHDTETEPNNSFTTADKLTSNVTTFGSLHLGEGIDLYRIDSNKNETISIDLCWQNTSCAVPEGLSATAGIPSNHWVLYVFDGNLPIEKLQAMLETPYLLDWQLSTDAYSNHPYFLADSGVLNDALIATIDPSFGSQTQVDLGISPAGKGNTYYIGISSPLRRTDGRIVHIRKKEIINQEYNPNSPECESSSDSDVCKDRITINVPYLERHYSDDQYVFRVTKTQMTPSAAGKRAQ